MLTLVTWRFRIDALGRVIAAVSLFVFVVVLLDENFLFFLLETFLKLTRKSKDVGFLDKINI